MSYMNLKNVTTDSNRDEFEDVLFSNELVVVQKEWSDFISHTQVVYVFAEVEDEMPIYGIFREITEDGTSYWKETY
ncbi:modifier of suppressor tRNAs [Serratia phage X20]|uniref:Modifier of suppressor tRNAs n=3 Tax=Winklervirus TaxID=2560256 RepID=A0A1Z1LYS8_9CAUD|nr:cef modifier of supressor tRNAs [Serratia phage CHI14]YP_010092162.1 cef modifier of supressor tRNAs [Serratia phage X20]ARW57434.1 modifier of suppressor tRNAs [Serratia phage CHI14]ARW57709.1 modifier of suppressor tRNAs [Serratia phage CBH8]ARW57984.1 modifier of suppressor tRNAs [Serratia phage X20]